MLSDNLNRWVLIVLIANLPDNLFSLSLLHIYRYFI